MVRQNGLVAAIAILLIVAAGLGYGWYAAQAKLAHTTASLASTTATLASTTAENQSLTDALTAEKARNDDFQKQINDIGGTVGKLDKLSQIDPQLLAKYSKVYFLNENYVPAHLVQIPTTYTTNGKEEYFLAEAWPFMKAMLDDARDDGIDISVASAYRAFETQKALKTSYTVSYGSGANSFSADQGYSEHQLGTAADFTSKEIGDGLSASFTTSAAGVWLADNAYKYGFILSYPSGNSYYVYEPWHWRFVGKDLARDLHDDGKHFYDLDQRDINEYLISLFDN